MILLDTCAIIWDALDQQQLSAKALQAINKADQANKLIISDISLWEIAMLAHKQRIRIDTSPANLMHLYLQTRNITVIPIAPEIAQLSTSFDATINKDPADRIICATSIIHNAQLVTADQDLLASDSVNTLW